MMLRITIAIVMLAGLANASVGYQAIDTTNFANRAAAYEGQLVSVAGQVCAVNADGKSIRLFDKDSRALIDVSLNHLQRSQRRDLMMTGVRQVVVYGKAEVKDGKLTIDAHKVSWSPVKSA